jgi:phenylpropionate dioxygenase-like ring-hydroxylating dioxygenase large terminal subunit
MIPNQWYSVAEARKLKGKPMGLERLGRKIVLWRDGSGTFRAALDRCPHRGAAPSQGKVLDGEIQCPWHGFRFGPDGACTRMPCEGSEARIPRGMGPGDASFPGGPWIALGIPPGRQFGPGRSRGGGDSVVR